jgi:hypothetical protein
MLVFIFGGKKGPDLESGQILGNFGEARCHPDKFAGPLTGQKVPFQDQASPNITRGPCMGRC